jgi:hypothetical protein
MHFPDSQTLAAEQATRCGVSALDLPCVIEDKHRIGNRLDD